LSDSYPQIHADALAWTVMLLEVVAALLLGLAGARELRAQTHGVDERAVAT
jgi:hypothetical protein